MLKIIRLFLLAVVVFVVVTCLSFVYLKWWQATAVVLAMVACGVGLIVYVIKNFAKFATKAMLKVFEVKSRVLRDATAEVHSIVPTAAPPLPEGENRDDAGNNYYRIHVTITPAKSSGPMQHWDLSDLGLVAFDTPTVTLEECEGVDSYPLRDEKVLQPDGTFVDDTQGKYAGPQQVQALVAVPPHVRELKFQYYIEQFGRITLPAPLPMAAETSSATDGV